MMTPRSPSSPGVFLGDGLGGKANHVEGADEVDIDGSREGFEAMRPFAAEQLFRGRDAGAVHQACRWPKVVERESDGCFAVVFRWSRR